MPTGTRLATTPRTPQVETRSTSFPFCFDWTPDGRLLATSATGLDRLADDGTLAPHVDLTHLSPLGWNEVAVDKRGNAYVNNVNFDMSGGFDVEAGSRSGLIAVVHPDGTSRQVADTIAFPNGMAITPGGTTLIVAESFAARLSAFTIDPDGSLSGRRIWAAVDDGCDGISIDAEGAVWCATRTGCVRVLEGGEITDRIPMGLFGFSCALGGPNGRTLAIVAAEWNGPENIGTGPRTGVVLTTEVGVPAP